MLIYPKHSRPLPAQRIEAFNHGESTFVIETQADYSDPRLPADIQSALTKRPTEAQRAKDVELAALFEQKEAANATAERRARFQAFLDTDPDAQVIKARR